MAFPIGHFVFPVGEREDAHDDDERWEKDEAPNAGEG